MFARCASILGWTLRVASALALGAAPSLAAAQESASAPSRSEIVEPITLSNTRDLDFGRIIAPRNGRVDMPATDTPVCIANNTLVLLDGCQSAAFTGNGAVGAQIRVRVPPRRRIVLTGPGRNLRLRRMAVGAGNGLTLVNRRFRNFDFAISDPSGDFEFFVGGRLLIRNNQAPGIYTGTFAIDVDYQ